MAARGQRRDDRAAAVARVDARGTSRRRSLHAGATRKTGTSLSRLLRIRRGHGAGRLRRQRAIPTDYDWLTSQGHRRARQDRARPLLGALQLSRLQGADGAAARRCRHPHLLRSRRRWRRKGKVYPDGPWGPDSHIQRGGIVYDFLVPGDPLTPGWASVDRRADESLARDAVSLPAHRQRAAVVRRRARDSRSARRTAKRRRHGAAACTLTYRAGPGPADRRACACTTDDRIRPVWTVTGIDSRQRTAGRDRHRRQPSRRLDLRRRRSVERIGRADGAGADARRR